MEFELLRETYLLACAKLTREDVDGIIDASLQRAREKHHDFDRFVPGMNFLSSVFFTDHAKMPIDDYIETLYCAVKHSDFARGWRAQLRTAAAVQSDGRAVQ